MGGEVKGWLDRLRRAHFPPERNHLSAHLTMFHALPPSMEGEVRHRLGEAASCPAPRASVAGVMSLGSGTALRIVSPDLEAIRADLAAQFHGVLSAQDGQGWRPHVTIQNKMSSSQARALKAEMEAVFEPRDLPVTGLGLHRYLGGPWEEIATFSFRGIR